MERKDINYQLRFIFNILNMGKLLKIIDDIRKMNDKELVSRFEKLSGAKTIREYTSTKIDKKLSTELNLIKEEILKRITVCNIHFASKID